MFNKGIIKIKRRYVFLIKSNKIRLLIVGSCVHARVEKNDEASGDVAENAR